MVLILTDTSGLLCDGYPYDISVNEWTPQTSTNCFIHSPFMQSLPTSSLASYLDCQTSLNCILTYQQEWLDPHDRSMRIYPNPFHTSTTISFDASHSEPWDLFVINSVGEVVREMHNITSNMVSISREKLGAGVYMVRMKGRNNFIKTEKMIVY